MMPTIFCAVGFAALYMHGATAAPVANAPGDPHMTGFQRQKLDFTGHDGAWYSVISDISDQLDQPSTHINMRVTSPVPELPEIAYITGLSVITTDPDGLDHSIVVQITDPHSLESACPVGMSPCLADGALTVEIDGKESLLAPGTVEVGPGVAISAANLPAACRSFDFESAHPEAVSLTSATPRYREGKEEGHVAADRKLSTVTGLQDMAYWILGDPRVANLDECTEYVAGATVSEEGGLFAHDSDHASFQILTPRALIRLSHGRVHQLPMRDPTGQFDLPCHRTWQMNLALEHHGLSPDASGILGGARGRRVMQGMQHMRGTQENYRVEGGPVETILAQGEHHEQTTRPASTG